MTIPAAKKEVAAKLTQAGIPFKKLTGKTVSFQDLLRLDAIFVTIHGAEFPEDFAIKSLTKDVPKPSEGGYCVQTTDSYRGGKPILFS